MSERREFHIIIAPPGAGKTTYKEKYPDDFIDPEESINWKEISKRHSIYVPNTRQYYKDSILEQELNWGTVWNRYILSRIYTAYLLEKDIIMGMITPSNAEIATRFLVGFKNSTTLFLPNEEQHHAHIWNNTDKRPRTWGPQLRGWQNTYWIRLLLQGIATTIPLPIVSELPERTKGSRRLRSKSTAACEIVTTSGQSCIATLSGKWAELNPQEEILALYNEITNTAGSHAIICDKTSKICKTGMHQCDTLHTLEKDVNGVEVKEWIASDKIRLPKNAHQKVAVIFFVGTLAPFHQGHLDILNTAKEKLEREGWYILGGYVSTFTNLDEKRTGNLSPILGDVHTRTTMIQLGTLDSDWIMSDHSTEHVLHVSLFEDNNHPTQRVLKRLRAQKVIPEEMEVTTFWVNGKDAHINTHFFKAFAHHALDIPMNPLRMAIIDNREGENIWSTDAIENTVPELNPFINRFTSSDNLATSATRIRAALENGNRNELRETVGIPLVESYLLGVMHEAEK
jgi:nicotinic acid mononucleotide adenylyltransferase